MSLFKKLKKGVKSIGNAVGDAFETVGDVVSDAWDNDLVKMAALAAGAYYAYPLVAGAGAAGGAGVAGAAGAAGTAATTTASTGFFAGAKAWASNAWTGLVDKAFLAGFQPNALGVAGYAAKGIATNFATSQAIGTATGMLAGGGGGGPQMPSMARMKVPSGGASTQYGTFKANVTNLGMDPRIADAMSKVAQTNIPSIRGAMNQVGRVSASGPNISLGSSSIGVRETTRAV